MRYFKRGFLSCLLISLFILIGCSKPETGIEFNNFIEQVNGERKEEVSSGTTLNEENYLHYVEGDKEGFTDEEFSKLIRQDEWGEYDREQSISSEEALDDIDYLFKLLKYGYGAYGFYGGDEVFNEVKNKIISEIENKDNLITRDISDLFIKNLSFIDDGHFSINGKKVNSKYNKVYISNEEMDIYLDTNGYYIVEDKEKLYLKSIDNNEENLKDYLKVSISKEGDLVYHIGTLVEESIVSTSVNLGFVNNNEEIYKSIILNNELERINTSVAYEKKVKDGIPIISVRKMHQISNEEKSLYDFIESGTNLKDNKVSIIDIRGNGGGTDIWGMEWFKNYTGQYPEPRRFSAQKYSRLFLENIKYTAESSDIKDEQTKERLKIANEKINKKEFEIWDSKFREGKWNENDNTIFVLIDKYVASSGESFLSYLRTLDNVIFIGTNTAGCDLVSNNFNCKLPNSNIELYFGSGISLGASGKSIEGIGFEPDIWINSKEALDRVIKLINSYGLK